MNSLRVNTPNQYNDKGISFSIDNLIILNFAVLVFFTFFGTKLPFQEVDPQASFKAETTNIVNQILYVFLFLSSMIIAIKRIDTISLFIKREKYLSLFILLCLASAIWSNYHFMSFKRSFQLLSVSLVVMNALLFIEPSKLLKVLKIIIILYLLITVFSSLFIGAAIDPRFGTWRGLSDHKNGLARYGFYCFIISLFFYGGQNKLSTKITNYAISFVSVIIVFMSGSSTGIVMIGLIIIISLMFSIEEIFKSLRIGRTLMILVFLSIISLYIVINILAPHLIDRIPLMLGKDPTLSLRTEIWDYVWMEIEKKIFLGYGFGTYWIMGSTVINQFAAIFGGFMINQAHNGYLEIMLQLGLVGITLFAIIVILLIFRIFKLESNLSLLVIISVLILDYTEATLFKSGISTLVFISLYIEISIFYFNLKEN
ncbi:MAG: O-antigen ligase family protein [Ignavibacteriaceae bacterium]|nr:O-antigen ligase family protein [Ignavibacteriaceae bacterium]